MPSRILIAEDDDLQGSLLMAAIACHGHEVDVVANGLEAVRRLRTGRYDLAVLDYSLPDLDGLAAARLMQDLLDDAQRPRMIAVTASAEQLQRRDREAGGSSFDVIVSKASGIAALLTTIEDNLALAVDRRPAGEPSPQHPTPSLRRRQRAWLAALPGLLMAIAFMLAGYRALLSLSGTQAITAAAKHTVAVGEDSGSLLGAVQNAEVSQRAYLIDGSQAANETFQANLQEADRLLSAPLTVNSAAPADASGAGPHQAVVQARLRQLTVEAGARAAGGAAEPAWAQSLQAARDCETWLRDWADRLLAESQGTVLSGVALLRHNLYLVLAVLGAGILYSCVSALRAFRRHSHPAIPMVTLRGPGDGSPSVQAQRRGGGLHVITGEKAPC